MAKIQGWDLRVWLWAALVNYGWIKVAEHSIVSYRVYVICQIMAKKRLQLTSWNLASENILMKDFDWQVKCDVFVVSMATWTIEYNLKISLLLSLHKIRSLDFPMNLHTAYYNKLLIITIWNLFDQILTDGFVDNQYYNCTV